MTPAVVLLANSSLTFSLYDFHLNGVSAQELATAYSLPVEWVKERLEAIRLCLKYQVKLDVSAHETTPPLTIQVRSVPVKKLAVVKQFHPNTYRGVPAMKAPSSSLAV